MKYLIYILLILSAGAMIFSLAYVNYNDLFAVENQFWLIGFGASLCTTILLLILIQSRKLKEEYDKRSK